MAKNKPPRKPYRAKTILGNQPIQTETRRTFDYKIGDVTLNFTLRTDIKDELIVFKRMLEKGIADVTEQLGKLDK